jgi:ribose transport system ATP-binding protein
MDQDKILLNMEHISKSFPGVHALKDVDFALKAGEVHALVGENGAGKSTLMKILAGVYPKTSGKIFIEGKETEINGLSQSQRLGINIIFQEFNLIPHLSIAENVYFGRFPRRLFWGAIDWKALWKNTKDILQKLSVDIDPVTKVKDLSVANMQMVEIAKALSMKSRILVMDEPTSALTQSEIDILFSQINKLKTQGVGIIFISHRLEEVKEISDRITVLRDGIKITTINSKEVSQEEIARMMVGREIKEMYPKLNAEIGKVLLEIKNLTTAGILKDINLTLHQGEILGIYGLVGAGRTEMVRAIFGEDKREKGEILIEGHSVSIQKPFHAVNKGIGLVPEDRSRQGLLLNHSVKNNLTLANLKKYAQLGRLDKKKEEKAAKEQIQALDIKTPNLDQKVLALSGGNQQKAVLGKWLDRHPKILILDEPTRGIDVGAKAEIHALMSRLAIEGMGIIMISSELPEVLGMSDRILVMNQGRITAEFTRGNADPQKIILEAIGRGNHAAYTS